MDTQEFNECLETARQVAYRHVYYEFGRRRDRLQLAEDASSQAVVKVLTLGANYFNDRQHVIRTAKQKAGWVVLDYFRRAHQRDVPLVGTGEMATDHGTPEKEALADERTEQLERGMEELERCAAQLPPELREVYELRKDGHNLQEIADQMGLTYQRARNLQRSDAECLRPVSI